MSLLTKKDFHFELPDHLVAHQALAQRDAARLMVRDASGNLSDHIVSDLVDLLPADSLLILNNTKVFPSRLIGNFDSGGKVEIFLLKSLSDGSKTATTSTWTALGKPFKKFKVGKPIDFGHGLCATVKELRGIDSMSPTLVLEFNIDDKAVHSWLQTYGIIPLPPYIKRDQLLPAAQSPDTVRYQTVYANAVGSVAAPTAGLHLTPELLGSLEKRGVQVAHTCLHVGAGTFLPVKSDIISEHNMHFESYSVPKPTITAIQRAITDQRPIVAVGTTSFRSLQSLAIKFPDFLNLNPEEMADTWHETDLFVYPKTKAERYQSKIFNGIMTNFHQPESTLLMLISALVGYDGVMEAYKWAIEREYRFFSYGDSSLLWLN
jgi:S-adenosylmethionine:tRNA ribosyltransferase-isomerase